MNSIEPTLYTFFFTFVTNISTTKCVPLANHRRTCLPGRNSVSCEPTKCMNKSSETALIFNATLKGDIISLIELTIHTYSLVETEIVATPL